MNIKLIGIEVDAEDSDFGPSGACTFHVNGKEVMIIVHGSGELDFEGASLSDEESDALMEAFNSSDAVNECFPSNQYH